MQITKGQNSSDTDTNNLYTLIFLEFDPNYSKQEINLRNSPLMVYEKI